MGSKLYVGGLPYSVTDSRLQEIFSAHGSVESARVIADNVSRLLGTKLISVYPQSAADHAPYRVLVDVQQFESALGSHILIDASWTIRHSDHGETALKMGRSSVEEPAGGPGYEALAAAHSRALVRISRDIAEAIRSMDTAP